MIMSITVYKNARFDPIDARSMMSTFSPISTVDACRCECYNNIICSTATYFGINRTCVLFYAQLNQGQLRVVPTVINATVSFFGNRSSSALQVFNSTNETVYAIWNTTAGGNSSPAVSGYYMGMYYPTEFPTLAFDNDLTTQYTSYGICNYNVNFSSTICGENTGLYLTLKNKSIILTAFYFGTNTGYPQRDPLTITIEGSNLNGSALTLGSSWTLIYNGNTGLIFDPGRSTSGTLQILPNPSMRFSSYRLLVTSKRGSETSASYTEFAIHGY